MKIVIDIPKGFYEHVKGHKDIFTYGLINGEKIGEIIANGIVLPEQHGDLIDRNEVKNKAHPLSIDVPLRYIDDAPTLLEGTINK